MSICIYIERADGWMSGKESSMTNQQLKMSIQVSTITKKNLCEANK